MSQNKRNISLISNTSYSCSAEGESELDENSIVTKKRQTKNKVVHTKEQISNVNVPIKCTYINVPSYIN